MNLPNIDILNKSLQNFKKIHMIGISGIGMAALAHVLHHRGHHITGSTNALNKQTAKLANKNIDIQLHAKENLQSPDLVILTQEIPHDNVELQLALANNIPCIYYPQAAGMLSREYKQTIAIAGTHGKSTCTSMLVTVLKTLGIPFSAIIGTDVPALDNKNYHIQDSDIFIIEACEYMQAFLNYKPSINLITNIEWDHFDYFDSEDSYVEVFQKLIDQSQYSILNTDYPLSEKLSNIDQTYSADQASHIKLNITGDHNRTNALGVQHICSKLGISNQDFKRAILQFTHSARRMEIISQTDDGILYTDYGHHPTEVKVTLQALREKHPNSKICLIFQPHQYNRTLQTLDLFKEAFVDCDKLIIPDIYDARDTQADKDAINVDKLLASINHPNKLNGKGLEQTKQKFAEYTKDHDIIVVMGAGNITKVIDYY